MTLNEKIEEYKKSQHFRALAKHSKTTYQTAMNRLVECFGGNTDLDFIAINLPKFVKFCEDKGLSGHSVSFQLRCAKLFLKLTLGFEVKFTYRIPREQIKARKLKFLKRWLTDEDVEKCLDYQFPWETQNATLYRIMVRILVETGMRFSELLSIKWVHINTSDRILMITDSKSEPRPVIFSPLTAEMIDLWKKSFTVEPDGSARVFMGAHKTTQVIAQMFHDLGLKTEKDHRGAHTFRHYCATKMFYDGGMRIEDVAFLLGDEPNTIVQNYLHPTPRMLRKRVDAAMGWRESRQS